MLGLTPNLEPAVSQKPESVTSLTHTNAIAPAGYALRDPSKPPTGLDGLKCVKTPLQEYAELVGAETTRTAMLAAGFCDHEKEHPMDKLSRDLFCNTEKEHPIDKFSRDRCCEPRGRSGVETERRCATERSSRGLHDSFGPNGQHHSGGGFGSARRHHVEHCSTDNYVNTCRPRVSTANEHWQSTVDRLRAYEKHEHQIRSHPVTDSESTRDLYRSPYHPRKCHRQRVTDMI